MCLRARTSSWVLLRGILVKGGGGVKWLGVGWLGVVGGEAWGKGMMVVWGREREWEVGRFGG